MPVSTEADQRTPRKRGRWWLLLPPIVLLAVVVITLVHTVDLQFGDWRITIGGMPAWQAQQDLEVKSTGFHQRHYGRSTVRALRIGGYAYVLLSTRIR